MKTTADCKAFIVSEIKKNPYIIDEIYGGKTEASDEALVEKNWKRLNKFAASSKHNYAQEFYKFWKPATSSARDGRTKEELSVVRTLCLLPFKYETEVEFLVLEDHNGNLFLGEYVGD